MNEQSALNTKLSSRWTSLFNLRQQLQGVLFFDKMTDEVLDTIREDLVVSV